MRLRLTAVLLCAFAMSLLSPRGASEAAWSLFAEAEESLLTAPMASSWSADVSACGYVASALHEQGSAAFTVSVPSEGDYWLWGRGMGLALYQNSFWVSVDGSVPIKYELPQFDTVWTFGWEVVHPAHEPVVPYHLSAGEHTLTFAARESNARLDAIWLCDDAGQLPPEPSPCHQSPTPSHTPSNTPTVTRTPLQSPTATATATPQPTLVLSPVRWASEAEEGAIEAPMITSDDPLASGSACVEAPVHEGGAVRYSMTITAAADYYLWARVMGRALNHNSFWVSVDGSAPIKYEIPAFDEQWVWGWEVVHPAHEPVVPYALSVGQHTIRFGARESDARLDALLLTTDPLYRPIGLLGNEEITPTCTVTAGATPSATASATPTAFLTTTPTRKTSTGLWLPLIIR